MKPLLAQLAPTAPHPLRVPPREESASILFVAALYVLENHDEGPPEPSFLQGEKT